jgi:hypothetical protein
VIGLTSINREDASEMERSPVSFPATQPCLGGANVRGRASRRGPSTLGGGSTWGVASPFLHLDYECIDMMNPINKHDQKGKKDAPLRKHEGCTESS